MKSKIMFYIFQSLNIVLSIYIPISTKNIIDSITIDRNDLFLTHSGIFVVNVLFFIITLSLSTYFKKGYEEYTIYNYREDMLTYIGYEKRDKLHDKNIGYFISRFNDDFENLRPFIIDVPYKRISNGLVIIIIFSVLLSYNIGFTVAMFTVFPIFYLIKNKMTKKLRKIKHDIQSDKEIINTNLEEFVKYNYSIKASGAMKPIIEKNMRSLRKYLINIFKGIRIEIFYDYFLATGLLNLISIIVYVYGGFLALQGRISIGTLTMFSLYYSKLWNPLEFYFDYPKIKSVYEVSYQRVEEILNFKQVKKDKVSLDFKTLEIDDLTLEYQNKVVLKDVNLTINKGDKIALLGANGSGKTSFINCLSGIIPDYEGSIYLNGIDLKNIDYCNINKLIKIIPAQPDIFFGTVKQNITMFSDIDIDTNNEILKILNKNNIGMDNLIGGSLENISGGEQKLIQLLRGFNSDAELYLIDEPLNYIDTNHKKTVISFLEKSMRNKTCLYISHDPEIFQITERTIEISNGTVKEVKTCEL